MAGVGFLAVGMTRTSRRIGTTVIRRLSAAHEEQQHEA